MDIKQAIQTAIDGKNLTRDQMTDVMKTILSGEATPAQVGGFLVALRIKGETIDEITAAAQVMRSLATPVTPKSDDLVDIVGTGGDGLKTFNISTASAIVAAAAGAHVAKHGNRAASSQSGSADLLELAGIRLDMNPAQVAQCIDQVGVGFMFAPAHHSAMKHAIGPRKEMAVRTIFNVLGPLTNPAGTKRNYIGVYDKLLVEPIAHVLMKLGNKHALVVHGLDGLDEISIEQPTMAAELKDDKVVTYEIRPENYGIQRQALSSIVVQDSAQSLAMIKTAFSGEQGPARDAIALNAGAGIYVAGIADSLSSGIAVASEVIASGAAMTKLDDYVAFSQNLN